MAQWYNQGTTWPAIYNTIPNLWSYYTNEKCKKLKSKNNYIVDHQRYDFYNMNDFDHKWYKYEWNSTVLNTSHAFFIAFYFV